MTDMPETIWVIESGWNALAGFVAETDKDFFSEYDKPVKYTRATPSSSVTMKREEVEKLNIFALNMCTYFAHHGFHPHTINFDLSQQALSILSDALENGGKK